ncbi:MAG: polyprenyl synthetase family protein [Chloroflexi bacterium]|jgi:geranylgeranyl diphosphate synthase type I|nr:polyprenyl synthetase family protein [Chloroflexota bacterium]
MTELNGYLHAVEAELRDILTPCEDQVAPLYQMMQYHLGWLNQHFEPDNGSGGKRLRPAMCLLACEAVGGDWRSALPVACAIELIHNFSLLHDDIEDDSATRRHRTTVWALWGIAQGINTGDAMWAISRLAVFRLRRHGFPPETILRVSELLDRSCLELCTGQYLDIDFERQDGVSLATYKRMILGKTAALLSGALGAGAIVGGANDATVRAYQEFGRELGLAFQITDDILGIWGDPQVTGKSAASDILTKKKTLPVLYAFQWENEQGYTDLERIYSQPTIASEDIPTVLNLLDRAGALEYAKSQAAEHQARTLAHLDATQITNPAQDKLRELALSIVDRSH